MKIDAYVKSKISGTALADKSARIFGNLAVAGIYPNSHANNVNANAVDALLLKLQSRLGVTAAPVKQKRTAEVSKSELENAGAATNTQNKYTLSLLKGIDPATGERLNKIKLMGDTLCLHNPSTRVVYPIPGSQNLPAYV